MKKLFALFVAFVLMFGCISFAETDGDAKKIIVGTNAEFAPFEFVIDNEIVGFDADLIEMIMALLQYEYEIISMDFDALLPALASGQIDLAIAAMTVTPERMENALFSDPYFDASQKIIVKNDSAIASSEDLIGKKIGVQLGTTGDLFVTDNIADAEVIRFPKALDAVNDLELGRLDAVVTDAEPSKFYVASFEDLKILDEEISAEKYGIAAAFGSEDLIAEVNEKLAYIFEEGYYDQLYALWFGEEEASVE